MSVSTPYVLPTDISLANACAKYFEAVFEESSNSFMLYCNTNGSYSSRYSKKWFWNCKSCFSNASQTFCAKVSKQPYDEHNNEIIVSADMVYTWVNNENPEEKIEIPWATIGQQADSSQALGSGLTYSMRYFLLKYFSIATPDDDVDNWRSKQKATEAAEDKAIAEQIINQVDESIKEYLTKNPKQSDKVKEFVSKYVKNGNYFAINESMLASKLLSEFKSTFLKEEA